MCFFVSILDEQQKTERKNFGDMELNNRVSKKIRKLLIKDTKESFNSFAEAINGCDFKARVKIAIKVLLGKL